VISCDILFYLQLSYPTGRFDEEAVIAIFVFVEAVAQFYWVKFPDLAIPDFKKRKRERD
jgi:hypothetical protein